MGNAGARPKLPKSYLQGFPVAWASPSTVTIGKGVCRGKNNLHDVVYTGGGLTADITASGANGLDTGVEAVSTFYFVHVIADSTGTNPIASLLSLSKTAPTLPGGYNIFRAVGIIRNDSAGNFVYFRMDGLDTQREIVYGSDVNSRIVLSAGAATVITDVSCAAFIPSGAIIGSFMVFEAGTQATFLYESVAIPINNFAVLVGQLFYVRVQMGGTGQTIAYNHPGGAGGSLFAYAAGYTFDFSEVD